MLRNFRQVFKGQQTPMAVIMMVVLLGMVAYLAPSSGNPGAPDNIVARAYGRDITRRDLDGPMRDMVRRLGKGADLEGLAPLLMNRALAQLVETRLMEELAERHGIVVTDAEVKNALEAQLRQFGFVDENNRLRSSTEINDTLREHGLSLKQLETETATGLAEKKLFQQVAAQVPVDDPWLQLENRARNEKISFEAATRAVDPSGVPDPGQPRLEAFLKDSGARFQSGPRRVVAYVDLDPVAMPVPPPDDASVQAVYDARKAQFVELKASHILFKAESDAQVADAMAKALDLRAKLLAGLDFNKAAEAQSQDPSAKGNKGELGWFQSGQMAKPFEEAALALKEGEISQPVRTSFGVHLIRMEGRRQKSFDQVKAQLAQDLARERFTAKAKDRLEELRKRTGDRGDILAAARNLGLKVQTSQPFPLDSPAGVPGLPGSQNVVADTFRMEVGQVSRVLPVQAGYVVFRVQEERPIAIPPLSEIHDQVLAAWKLEEGRKATLAKVQEALKGGDLKAVGQPSAQDGVTLASLGELGKHPAIRKALLETPVGQLTPPLWTPDGRIWVARIRARVAPAPLTFATRKALVEQIQGEAAQKLIMAELDALERDGNLHPGFSSLYGRLNGIWRNKELLGKAADTIPDFNGLDD
jgi:peptidyl-prolyl cis-trans isomerase D